MGRSKSDSPNHFTTEKLADNHNERTCHHCVNCIKAQSAVRILKTTSMSVLKVGEHLPICEGLSDGERRKLTAQILVRGGIQHSFVTHNTPFEGDTGNHGKGLVKRSVNEDEGVGGGVWGGSKGVSGSSGAAGGSTGP